MSPYEVPPPSTAGARQAALQALLPRFDVTSNGFLPETVPLERLPNPYYSPWESLMQQLPSHIQDNTFRSHIDNLPILSLDQLENEQEQRRAYLILTFFLHAYVWGGSAPAEVLPPSVTVPLLRISDILGLPPVATFASFNLWNFTSSNPTFDLTDVDSLRALHTFTGTQDESWFYMVSVAIEAQGAYIIPVLLHGLDALQSLVDSSSTLPDAASDSEDEFVFFSPQPHPSKSNHLNPNPETCKIALTTATKSLTDLITCISKMGALLDRMYSRCDPIIFYHRIRPFLAGSKNMGAAGLPRGVFYDEGDHDDHGDKRSSSSSSRGEYRQLRGGSNGQSSLIQFLDIVLGVEHSSSGNSSPEEAGNNMTGLSDETLSFHQEVRSYMPRRHREFLEYVVEHGGGGFRGVISQLGLGVEEGRHQEEEEEQGRLSDLIKTFKMATRALADFRNKHLQLVTRYIIIPSRQQRGQAGSHPHKLAVESKTGRGVVSSSSSTDNEDHEEGIGAREGTEGEVGAVTRSTSTSTSTSTTTFVSIDSKCSSGRKRSVHYGGELTGTGGTALLPFLKQSRDETLQAGDLGIRKLAT